MSKNLIRDHYKKIRGGLLAKDKRLLDQAILERFLASPIYRQSQHIMCFVSFSSEVDTHGIIQRILDDKKQVYVPITGPGPGQMQASRLDSFQDLELGPYHILRPAPGHIRLVDPSILDLILVPGLAFDKYGYRLGYGGGYYDRFLAQENIRAHTMGIFYTCQEADFLIHADYDIPVKTILTEKALQVVET